LRPKTKNTNLVSWSHTVFLLVLFIIILRVRMRVFVRLFLLLLGSLRNPPKATL
jgi:hypothetical protein